MRFEWDEEKNRSNIRKHGVSFETAARIFDGPYLTWIDDREAYAEERSISIGMVESTAILTVAHAERASYHKQIS